VSETTYLLVVGNIQSDVKVRWTKWLLHIATTKDPYGTLWKLMNMFKISNKTFIVSFHRIELQQGWDESFANQNWQTKYKANEKKKKAKQI